MVSPVNRLISSGPGNTSVLSVVVAVGVGVGECAGVREALGLITNERLVAVGEEVPEVPDILMLPKGTAKRLPVLVVVLGKRLRPRILLLRAGDRGGGGGGVGPAPQKEHTRFGKGRR